MGNSSSRSAATRQETAWRIQHKLKPLNPMYEFVDLDMGGKLVTQYLDKTDSADSIHASQASKVDAGSVASVGTLSVTASATCTAVGAAFAPAGSLHVAARALHAAAGTIRVSGRAARAAGGTLSISAKTSKVEQESPGAIAAGANGETVSATTAAIATGESTNATAAHSAEQSTNRTTVYALKAATSAVPQSEIEKKIEEELVSNLYKKDTGSKRHVCIIRDQIDYNDWRDAMLKLIRDQDKEVRAQFSPAEYEQDAFNKFRKHEACWDLRKRGWVGETPLLICFLMNTPKHMEAAKKLLEKFPEMALDVYEGREFFGESALHFAVVNGDLESVKLLVRKKAKIDQRATGRFFRPRDQQENPSGYTNYEGDAYYGEYPLAFAASKGYIEIYDYLCQSGADPDSQDSFGNTVLHMAVIHDQLEMFLHAVKTSKADLKIRNNRRLTPLTLASELGRSRMFREILDLGSVKNWGFGEVNCYLYPLATLDSINPKGNTDWESALLHVVQGDTDDHLEMLEGAVVKQLLREKWMKFGRRMFIQRLLWAALHLVSLSVALYTRPAGDKLLQDNGLRDRLRYFCEILVCLSCALKMVETGLVIYWHSLSDVLKTCQHAPAQAIYLISCALVLLCILFRLTGLHVVEDVLLMVAAPGSWIFLLFFARGLEKTGPFVVMVYKMCTGDLFRFGVIYMVFFVGFTTGFFFLFRDVQSDNEDVKKYLTFGGIILNLFQMTMGEFKYEVFDSSHYPVLSKLVFFVFMVLMSVLLLQMLIAMMGNTYSKVISRARKEWLRQWANLVLVLERTSFSRKALQRYQEKYSKDLKDFVRCPSSYSKDHSRGLMVIKKEESRSDPTLTVTASVQHSPCTSDPTCSLMLLWSLRAQREAARRKTEWIEGLQA